MIRKTLSMLAPALAGITLVLVVSPASADHGSEYSNHIARRPMATDTLAGMSRQEFLAQAERAWDRQQQAGKATDGRLSAEQVQAVRRALAEPEVR